MKDLSYGPNKIGESSYVHFMFGIPKFSGNEVEVISASFQSCRDGLLSTIADSLGTINTDKTHMLLNWCAGSAAALPEEVIARNNLRNQKWIENSVRLLHLYERIAGWPLTKTYKVKTDKDNIKLYYFLSSRRWIKAPYLMSLYILLIRIGKLEYLDDFKTYDDLTEIVNKLSAGKQAQQAGCDNDERYITNTFPYWKTIAENYGELFRKKKIEYYWSKERLTTDSYVGYEGIDYLSSGNTHNSTLYKRFMELHKKKEG